MWLETEKAHLYISFLGIEPADAHSSGQLIKKNMQMGERLVDILNSDEAVVHTFPITLSSSDTASDIDYQTKRWRRRPMHSWCDFGRAIAVDI